LSGSVPWIGAQAESFEDIPNYDSIARKQEKRPLASKAYAPEFSTPGTPESVLRAHQFPSQAREENAEMAEGSADLQLGPDASTEELDYAEMHALDLQLEEQRWEERRRVRELQREREMDRRANLRRYRGRTVKMLRRYMRMAIEAGRLPSVLGSAFFRSGVTSYGVMTFEDRVIFVRDMEICLEKLDEFSWQAIGRYILQGQSLPETAKVLHCDEKTIRRNIWMGLDDCSEILLKMGLLYPLESNREKSCQGGKSE
jgi:hypothetical protein